MLTPRLRIRPDRARPLLSSNDSDFSLPGAAQNPPPVGDLVADAVLDPWPEHVSDVLTTQVGSYSYVYDQMTL